MALLGLRWRHHLRRFGWSLVTGPLATPLFMFIAINVAAFVSAATEINFLVCATLAASITVFLQPRRRLLEIKNRKSLQDAAVNPGESKINDLQQASYLNRVLIIQRDDGNYTWHHEAYWTPDPLYDSETVWHEVQPTGGGIFDSYDQALNEAKHHLPWLRAILQPQIS